MKRTFIWFFVLVIVIFTRCSNDFLTETEKGKIDKKSTSLSQCSGTKDCLPIIDVFDTGSGTTITWGCNLYGHGCGQFLLTCTGIGSDINKYIEPVGTIYFSHSLTEYTFNYTVQCISDNTCRNCRDSKSFVKKANNHGEIGNLDDCQKEYLSYAVEQGKYGSGFKLVNRSSDKDINNKNDYLQVDSYEIYRTRYGYRPELEVSGSLIIDQSYSCPEGVSEYYEIRFYSSACAHKEKHYLYLTYMATGSGISNPNLSTFKAH